MLDAEAHALGLARELEAGMWWPGPARGFWIREPKLRLISALPLRDRMRLARALYALGAIGPEDIASRVRAWIAHAAHGHTRVLCARELGRLAFGVEERR